MKQKTAGEVKREVQRCKLVITTLENQLIVQRFYLARSLEELKKIEEAEQKQT